MPINNYNIWDNIYFESHGLAWYGMEVTGLDDNVTVYNGSGVALHCIAL